MEGSDEPRRLFTLEIYRGLGIQVPTFPENRHSAYEEWPTTQIGGMDFSVVRILERRAEMASFADEFQHPDSKHYARTVEAAIKPDVSLEEWEMHKDYVREINRDALAGTVHPVDEMMRRHREIRDFFASGRAAIHEQYCKELDERNALIVQLLKSQLGPYMVGLTQDDIESLSDDFSRLELEFRHGGEERYGGQSGDVQLELLKRKMADLAQRNLVKRGEGGSDEDGSDWLENSGFWHKR
jgi:hypothetical protein